MKIMIVLNQQCIPILTRRLHIQTTGISNTTKKNTYMKMNG